MFLMGSPANEKGRAESESPRHEVRIGADFEIGVYPVTFAEWDAAVAAGAKLHAPDDCGWGRDRRPVINVSWRDAHAYIGWLNRKGGGGFRLPTEAEWEYACRAGALTRYPHGDSEDDLPNYAWTEFNAGDMSQPVGQLRPNGYGLYDMLGNVWEWCEDNWHESYRVVSGGYQANAPTDGSAWREGGDHDYNVLRGGSWNEVGPQVFRSADRCGGRSMGRKDDVGFRLARTLP
jgi:formylglycine-generating enzyme required for sulfatase activity